jgi:hypothetical protein
MLRGTQMMNILLVAKQGNHGGIAPTKKTKVSVGAVPPCQPLPLPLQEFLPRNIRL